VQLELASETMLRDVLRKATKAFSLISTSSYRSALLGGVAAAVEHEAVLRVVQSDCVVDIGANKGQFALVARRFLPNATIYSFEPLRRPAAIFRNVFQDDSRVTLFQFAIGPEDSETLIHVSERDDSSSILPITQNQVALFPGTAESGTETIKIAPLSHLLPRESLPPNGFLKLDVQGFELSALAGCEEVLASFGWVYVECSFIELYSGQALVHEVIEWLHERGFSLGGVYNVNYDQKGLSVQADFLFQRLDGATARNQ
jgi:FkbM family methyltransferase